MQIYCILFDAKYFQDESCGIEKEEGTLSLPSTTTATAAAAGSTYFLTFGALSASNPHPSHCLSRDM